MIFRLCRSVDYTERGDKQVTIMNERNVNNNNNNNNNNSNNNNNKVFIHQKIKIHPLLLQISVRNLKS